MAKDKPAYDFTNKNYNINVYVKNTLNKISSMFKYHNLPDSVPAFALEKMLLSNGFSCIAKVDNELYAFTGGLGGEPNVYYEPTICTVANPALNLSRDFVIDSDCIIIKNDSYRQGMIDIITRYATMLAETDISINITLINSRLTRIFSAGDNQTKESAIQYLNDVARGKLGVIADNTFIESLKINSVNSQNQIFNELITLNQYLKASLSNEIGLQSNTQLKKERLISAEVESNSDSIYPIVDDMLNCRREGIEKVNKMFGTSIEVEFNSSWDYRTYNGMSIHNTSDEIDIDNVSRETSDDVSGDDVSGDDVSGDDVSGDDVSGDDVSGDDVSGDDVSGDDVSGDDVSGNDVSRETSDERKEVE